MIVTLSFIPYLRSCIINIWVMRPSFSNLRRLTMFRNLNISPLDQFFQKVRNSTAVSSAVLAATFFVSLTTKNFFAAKLRLISTFVIDHVKRFIYVEAKRQNDINKVERLSAICPMQKFVHLKKLDTKLQLISAFVVDHVKGFIDSYQLLLEKCL